jgi:hypothetical protein
MVYAEWENRYVSERMRGQEIVLALPLFGCKACQAAS